MQPSQLKKSNWINGPNFLWQEIADWEETRVVPALAENDPEVKGVVSLITVINSLFPSLLERLSHFFTGNVLRRLWHCVGVHSIPFCKALYCYGWPYLLAGVFLMQSRVET